MPETEINLVAELPETMTLPAEEIQITGDERSSIAISRTILDKVTTVASHQAGVDCLKTVFKNVARPTVLSFVNAHALNLCHKDAAFRDAILRSDIVFRDGIGMEIFFRSANEEAGHNMCGTDVIPMVLNALKQESLAVFGTTEPYLTRAVEQLEELGHNVVSVINGFESTDVYVNTAIRTQPAVIVLAMGMPRQEKLSMALLNALQHRCLIINGGAIIDHYGGKVDRAPAWMRNHGLEWLYRLIHEPVRLFNRYVIGNIAFLYRVYRTTGKLRLR